MLTVALLRGINVGTAPRVGMARLRELVEALGATGVRSYLQSGNLVFDGSVPAGAIEAAVHDEFGVAPRVLTLAASEFWRVAAENPLLAIATDPSRLFTTFVETVPSSIETPLGVEPDVVAIGERAVYQWLPDGFSKSRVPASFTRSLGPTATARNQRTVDALLAMLDADA